MFLETSALTGENVEEAFLKCSRTILGKIETGKTETGLLWCFLLINRSLESLISQLSTLVAIVLLFMGFFHYSNP